MYLGTCGPFSTLPFRRLLSAGLNVCVLGTPLPASATGGHVCPPVWQNDGPDTITSLANDGDVPIEYIGSPGHHSTLSRLASYEPDVVIVSCFPLILPGNLLNLPPLGCLNLHPSLLPAYRGPAPLFWQFRQGECNMGVTLHLMSEHVDGGDIVGQRAVSAQDGLTGHAAEVLLARYGAELLIRALSDLAQGHLDRRPQDEATSSYHPWPAHNDFQVSTHWTAQRAFNFILGTAEYRHPYPIQIGQDSFLIQKTLSYAAGHELGTAYVLLGNELWIQFRPGVMRTKIGQGSSAES
jgi:methionyl-tRNA formyltransferase